MESMRCGAVAFVRSSKKRSMIHAAAAADAIDSRTPTRAVPAVLN